MKNICFTYYNLNTNEIDLVQMVCEKEKTPFVLGDLTTTQIIKPWTAPTLSYEFSMCQTLDEAAWRTKKYLEGIRG